MTRGTVEEHWTVERERERETEADRQRTVDRRARCVAEKISEGSTADRMDGTMPEECGSRRETQSVVVEWGRRLSTPINHTHLKTVQHGW